jgi:hypothetical protein
VACVEEKRIVEQPVIVADHFLQHSGMQRANRSGKE